MVKNIKKVWKDGSASCDEPLNPPTLDGFVLSHVNVPQQENGFALVLLSFFFFVYFCVYSVLHCFTEPRSISPISANCINNVSLVVPPSYWVFFLYSEMHCSTILVS